MRGVCRIACSWLFLKVSSTMDAQITAFKAKECLQARGRLGENLLNR